MKNKKKLIVVLLLLISVACFLYGAGTLIYQQYQRNKSQDVTGEIIESVEKFSLDSNIPFLVDFDELMSKYPDVVAWIYNDNEFINNPIVKGKNNDSYIHSLLDGSYNIAGTLFIEEDNKGDFSDYMTVIYGHNMKNDSMFGSLSEYKLKEYYDLHPYMYLFLPEETYYLEVIGSMIITETSSIYNVPTTIRERNAIYNSFVHHGYYKTDVTLEDDDRLVLLSTCCDWDKTLRFVVLTKISEIPLGVDKSVADIFGRVFE